MPQYIQSAETPTVTAGDVILALTTGLEELSRITEIAFGGEATASAVNRYAVRRSTTNGVTPVAQTAAKGTPMSQAAYTSGAVKVGATQAFTTQPVTAAVPGLWTYSMNAFGGVIRWVAAPGQEIYIIGATAGNNEVSSESSSGTSAISHQLVFEEL